MARRETITLNPAAAGKLLKSVAKLPAELIERIADWITDLAEGGVEAVEQALAGKQGGRNVAEVDTKAALESDIAEALEVLEAGLDPANERADLVEAIERAISILEGDEEDEDEESD